MKFCRNTPAAVRIEASRLHEEAKTKATQAQEQRLARWDAVSRIARIERLAGDDRMSGAWHDLKQDPNAGDGLLTSLFRLAADYDPPDTTVPRGDAARYGRAAAFLRTARDSLPDLRNNERSLSLHLRLEVLASECAMYEEEGHSTARRKIHKRNPQARDLATVLSGALFLGACRPHNAAVADIVTVALSLPPKEADKLARNVKGWREQAARRTPGWRTVNDAK